MSAERQPAPCPICREPDGFHDYGMPGSIHEAHAVPRHLVIPTAKQRETGTGVVTEDGS